MRNESAGRGLVSILLVDDRPENLIALSAILNDPEYQIVTATSGAMALSCLLRQEFAVVILDVMMPEMDGYQVAALMKSREKTQQIPIIFLTAIATDVTHIYKGYSMGGVDYLTKPIDSDILRAKVSVFVALFRAKKSLKEQTAVLLEVERQAQEARLALQRKESEAWFSTTLRSIADAVIATDVQGFVRFVNPIAEGLTGWMQSEAFGRPIENIFRILNEETRVEVENPVTKVLREGVFFGLANHTLLISRTGEEFMIENSAAPIRDERSTLLGVVIAFRDETEKKRELKRRGFISKASQILLSSLDYIDTLNGVARLASEAFSDCFIAEVYSNEGTLERIAIAHRSRERVEAIQKVSNWSLNFAKKIGFKSYICVPIDLRGTRLGALTALAEDPRHHFSSEDIEMLQDLASRVSAAIENSRLYEGAQKAIRLRDEFLSIASHELRTPITPLKLQLQTIKNLAAKRMIDTYPKEKINQMFTIADKQMDRFQKLIEELLEVSRISVGRLKLEKQDVDLASVVKEVVSQFAGELKRANCHIETHVSSVMGEWDKLRIEQVLINLLANAMKYGVGKPIDVTVEPIGDLAQLKVTDRGPGISKEDQARIFSRFERAASARHFPGLGLGLYITKQILEAHGGSVHVESEVGQGATFTVQLPRKQRGIESQVA